VCLDETATDGKADAERSGGCDVAAAEWEEEGIQGISRDGRTSIGDGTTDEPV